MAVPAPTHPCTCAQPEPMRCCDRGCSLSQNSPSLSILTRHRTMCSNHRTALVLRSGFGSTGNKHRCNRRIIDCLDHGLAAGGGGGLGTPSEPVPGWQCTVSEFAIAPSERKPPHSIKTRYHKTRRLRGRFTCTLPASTIRFSFASCGSMVTVTKSPRGERAAERRKQTQGYTHASNQ